MKKYAMKRNFLFYLKKQVNIIVIVNLRRIK